MPRTPKKALNIPTRDWAGAICSRLQLRVTDSTHDAEMKYGLARSALLPLRACSLQLRIASAKQGLPM
jgi:hypothetical protein